jgi:hypothetical protein
MYSLTDRTPIARFASNGEGPDDFLSCDCFVHSGTDSLIYALDRQKGIYRAINVPSSLVERKLQTRLRFRYAPEIHPYSDFRIVDDNHYVGYNMWYLNSAEYNNHVPALKKYPVDEQPVHTDVYELYLHGQAYLHHL